MKEITIEDEVCLRVDSHCMFRLPPSYQEALGWNGEYDRYYSHLSPKGREPRRVIIFTGRRNYALHGQVCLSACQQAALDVKPGDLVRLRYDSHHGGSVVVEKATHDGRQGEAQVCGSSDGGAVTDR